MPLKEGLKIGFVNKILIYRQNNEREVEKRKIKLNTGLLAENLFISNVTLFRKEHGIHPHLGDNWYQTHLWPQHLQMDTKLLVQMT